MDQRPNIFVVGAGRVGLANATYLALLGRADIFVTDHDPKLIKKLRAGIEPYSVDYFQNLFDRVTFYENPEELTENIGSSSLIICFGPNGYGEDRMTPMIETILRHIETFGDQIETVIIRGTITPADVLELFSLPVDVQEKVVLYPEFLTEGAEKHGVIRPGQNFLASLRGNRFRVDKASEVYGSNSYKYLDTAQTAAAVKIFTNIGLAFKVTLANTIWDLTRGANLNLNQVLECIEKDDRLGRNYLRPGPGFGGSCLPWAVDQYSRDHRVLESIADYNHFRPGELVKQLTGATLFFGYNFKGGVQDIRNSQPLSMISQITDYNVWVTDDHYHPSIKEHWVEQPLDFVPHAENIVIFYSTKKLIQIEEYLTGDPNPKDLEEWNSKNIIDFR